MPERTTSTAPRGRLPRLTLPQLWVCLAVLLPVLGSLLATLSTVDLAYHVRAGEFVLGYGAPPSPDTFTFTAAGLPWLDQQWAAQVVFAAVFRLGGWALLAVARAVLVGLVAALVLLGCRWAGAGLRLAAWLTLAGFAVGLVALGLRPQLLGMVLFAATVAILAGRQRRPRLVWAIPLLVIVWASVHGSFFLGPAAVAVAWLEDLVAARPGARRLLTVGLVSALATLVNPYGVGVWTYAGGVAANPTIRRLISEWQTTSPLSFTGLMLYGSIAAVVVVLAIAVRRGAGTPGGRGRPAVARFLRRTWPTLAWLAGLAAIGAFAERGVAWWSIGFPVALAGLLRVAAEATADSEPRVPGAATTAPKGSLVATAVAALLLIGIVALLPVWRASDPLFGPIGLLADAPAGITAAVRAAAQPGDRIWNSQRWGSWLEFAVPDAPVAVDSRIELIPTDAWDDHLAVSRGDPDWAAILDRRGVRIVVASATEQRGLIPLLSRSPAWRSVYADADGAVFVKAGPSS
jgi:hypothetical protein